MPAWFGDLDAVLGFAAPGAASRGLASTGDPVFCGPWQLLGCPAEALLAGSGAGGLPLVLQLNGRPGDDRRLLAAARWAEAVLAVRSPQR